MSHHDDLLTAAYEAKNSRCEHAEFTFNKFMQYGTEASKYEYRYAEEQCVLGLAELNELTVMSNWEIIKMNVSYYWSTQADSLVSWVDSLLGVFL